MDEPDAELCLFILLVLVCSMPGKLVSSESSEARHGVATQKTCENHS